MDKNLFVVKTPPDEEATTYVLLIQRGGGMMGGGGTVAIGADAMEIVGVGERDTVHRVYVKGQVVAEFPYGTPYLLIQKHQVESLTRAEALERDLAEDVVLRTMQREHRKTQPADDDDDETDTIAGNVEGAALSLPGQYL